MKNFEGRHGQKIQRFLLNGRVITSKGRNTLHLQVEFYENRTEIWIVEVDNAGEELQRWNVTFVECIVWRLV